MIFVAERVRGRHRLGMERSPGSICREGVPQCSDLDASWGTKLPFQVPDALGRACPPKDRLESPRVLNLEFVDGYCGSPKAPRRT